MGIADLSSVFQMTVGLTIAAVVVPSILIFLIIRFRQNLAGAKGFSLLLVFGLAYGILLRFLIAPFTGHPQDLAYWTDPIRMFYESGIVDMRLYPMPFTYYPVLLSYSPYALLKVLGFQDSTFLAHSTGVLESLFVKLPFILADIFSVYFLYRILGKLRSDESISSRSQRLGYALLYFLSPVLACRRHRRCAVLGWLLLFDDGGKARSWRAALHSVRINQNFRIHRFCSFGNLLVAKKEDFKVIHYNCHGGCTCLIGLSSTLRFNWNTRIA